MLDKGKNDANLHEKESGGSSTVNCIRDHTLRSSSDEESSDEDDKYDQSGLSVILDNEENEEQFLALKRSSNGEALSKNSRTGELDPMPIENFLNPVRNLNGGNRNTKKTAAKRKKPKIKRPLKRLKINLDTFGSYDVSSALAQAPTGLTFGQLWRGDAANAKKDLDHIFGKGELKVGVIDEIQSHAEPQKKRAVWLSPLSRFTEPKFVHSWILARRPT